MGDGFSDQQCITFIQCAAVLRSAPGHALLSCSAKVHLAKMATPLRDHLDMSIRSISTPDFDDKLGGRSDFGITHLSSDL